MKKKNVNSLQLNKKVVASFKEKTLKGGTIPNNNTFDEACVTQMITMCFGAPQCQLFATVELGCRTF